MDLQPEHLIWIEQAWLKDCNCDICHKRIPAETLYWRACANPDSPDEHGYNACVKCKKQLPDPPKFRK